MFRKVLLLTMFQWPLRIELQVSDVPMKYIVMKKLRIKYKSIEYTFNTRYER